MRTALLTIIAICIGAPGCGHEIGDSCSISSDCSSSGDRLCDIASTNGYCTIPGCDFDTCPEEATCVRFFSVGDTNIPCESNDECLAEELCTLGGFCVPRSAEVRFCMRKCGSDGDCRDNYECRTEQLMKDHGGEPVGPPGTAIGEIEPFCAQAPPS